jgi:hypothetical protein
VADLVVVQAGLVLGELEGFLDTPTTPRDPDTARRSATWPCSPGWRNMEGVTARFATACRWFVTFVGNSLSRCAGFVPAASNNE